MNTKRIVVWTLIGLAVAWLPATYLMGGPIERRYNEYVDALVKALPMAQVVERSYDRGIIDSRARLTLRLKETGVVGTGKIGRPDGKTARPAALPSFTITLDDLIHHGPFPDTLLPAGSRIRSTLSATPLAGDAADAKPLPDAAPITLLTADTRFGFGSSYRSTLNSPARQWKSDDGKLAIDWQGFEGSADGDAHSHEGRFAMRSPGLKALIDDGTGKGEITVGKIEGETERSAGDPLELTAGQTRLVVDALRFRWQRAGQAESVGEFDDLRMRSTITRNGEFADLETRGTGKGRIDKETIDRIEYVEHWKRLHAPTLERVTHRILDRMGRTSDGDSVDKAAFERLSAAIADDLKGLLPHNPEYAVAPLSLTLNGTPGSIGWRIQLEGLKDYDPRQPPLHLLAGLKAGFDLKAPRVWVEKLAELAAGGEKTPIPSAQLTDLVRQGEMMGFLRNDNGVLTSEVRLDGGRLQVNGKELFNLAALPQPRRPSR
ncbi:MAG: DUF945 family protein [Burkholderiaceae bacterium]